MKMKRKLLPAVSVFFCILILAGCGIATIFYITGSVTIDDEDSDIFINASFNVYSDEYNNLDLIKTGTGPSLMLFYILTDSNDTSFVANIKSNFSSIYKNSPYGKIVNTSVSNPIVLTYTNTVSNKTYDLFAFSDPNRVQFSAPHYIASADDPNNSNFSFSLTRDGDTSLLYEIIPTIISGDFSVQTSENLRRYNGNKFLSDTNEMTDKLDYESISVQDIQDSTYYCHVFAAMCVSEGSFNNIFWTSLASLGYIKFPTITT
ncbi:hypothetical protein SpiGrapes_0430 [Sphaerochaeta pleomorpha str. Grapes]|uniref:Lipoprotein n=1 Tax=Sphaerochaeta pleomorpha (strain ATCC BAA-1885 / DSM 22778 / Grapes) TaxID=158190 RepID=G8QW45_SPHPG|nr:hypothetical protein [Sphaerochaeta pleomorpha]AEV28288.1 hypothetical protein SpiGrapes_0430 [Sphaerochaeta pleomorpha str. Grapes]